MIQVAHYRMGGAQGWIIPDQQEDSKHFDVLYLTNLDKLWNLLNVYFEYIFQEIRPKILKPRNTYEIAQKLPKKFAIFGRGLVMAIF